MYPRFQTVFPARFRHQPRRNEVGYGEYEPVRKRQVNVLFVYGRRENENIFPASRRTDRDRLAEQGYREYVRDPFERADRFFRSVTVRVGFHHRAKPRTRQCFERLGVRPYIP